MKLQQIINSESSLKKLLDTQLPVKVAYKISKIVNLIEPDLKIFNEQRDKLIKELGTHDKDKDIYTVEKVNLSKFADEIGKLTDIEVNLGFGQGKDLEKIKVDDLGDIKVAAADLVQLDWLLE